MTEARARRCACSHDGRRIQASAFRSFRWRDHADSLYTQASDDENSLRTRPDICPGHFHHTDFTRRNPLQPALARPRGRSSPAPPNDMKRNYCAADVRGGVQLVKQRSDAPCIFNQTWGYMQRPRHLGGPRLPRRFPDWRLRLGRLGQGLQHLLRVRQRRTQDVPHRHARGRADRSPNQRLALRFRPYVGLRSSGGIWVDRGCRADFQIGGGGGGGGGWQPGGPGVQVVNCSSDDMRRRTCPVNTSGGVRLIRQRSDADCIYGRTWGYDRNGIWVDRGCRADFEVGRLR